MGREGAPRVGDASSSSASKTGGRSENEQTGVSRLSSLFMHGREAHSILYSQPITPLMKLVHVVEPRSIRLRFSCTDACSFAAIVSFDKASLLMGSHGSGLLRWLVHSTVRLSDEWIKLPFHYSSQLAQLQFDFAAVKLLFNLMRLLKCVAI